MRMFYTYLHRRADDGLVFYVGKGRGRRARRPESRSAWWRNVATKHGCVVEILAHWTDEADALSHERLLISCLREIGHPLVNLTDGGEGSSGYTHTEEGLSKMRAAWKTRPKLSAESIAKQVAANTGRKHTVEARAKMSAARRATAAKGVSLSAEHKNNIRAGMLAYRQRQRVHEVSVC